MGHARCPYSRHVRLAAVTHARAGLRSRPCERGSTLAGTVAATSFRSDSLAASRLSALSTTFACRRTSAVASPAPSAPSASACRMPERRLRDTSAPPATRPASPRTRPTRTRPARSYGVIASIGSSRTSLRDGRAAVAGKQPGSDAFSATTNSPATPPPPPAPFFPPPAIPGLVVSLRFEGTVAASNNASKKYRGPTQEGGEAVLGGLPRRATVVPAALIHSKCPSGVRGRSSPPAKAANSVIKHSPSTSPDAPRCTRGNSRPPRAMLSSALRASWYVSSARGRKDR
eukprot:170005-Chlamydomonas_euryale.AAC.3